MNIRGLFNQSTTCSCAKYLPLELSRDQVEKRIKESQVIQKSLDLQCESPNGHSLFQCKFCKQAWQLSSAWNWGGKTYVFKVPNIEISEWLDNPYVSPADMLIYSALVDEYLAKNNLIASDKSCKIENCREKALMKNVLCKYHFIESLQKVGLLPKPPVGRIFAPYSFTVSQ
jgi:hypothetical protein